ncbi:DNA polymerase clamp loader subunit [Vibrio phage vB_VchM_Kuja]|uniref:DNA polymerase clamp loader subunit n=1 Tax=Vibrio phage vB_VchM_Kuja TaxID=2686437 RepID=A0A6B9J5J0_9CAUD|nr:DNA polymerase clamp loader subunit [Vibrio phage vB_VchM_Kuja]QGZ15998.1 DNA polymerase clamp loader subunit [Vibrio phage vB_VchM_Kuja]
MSDNLIKPDLFEWVNAIGYTKTDLFNDPNVDQSSYDPFMVTRALGMNIRSIEYADLAQHLNLPKDIHFQFLRNILPKGEYKGKWPKKMEVHDDIPIIQEYYKCGLERAEYYRTLLNKQQIKEIRKRLDKGGRIK